MAKPIFGKGNEFISIGLYKLQFIPGSEEDPFPEHRALWGVKNINIGQSSNKNRHIIQLEQIKLYEYPSEI